MMVGFDRAVDTVLSLVGVRDADQATHKLACDLLARYRFVDAAAVELRRRLSVSVEPART